MTRRLLLLLIALFALSGPVAVADSAGEVSRSTLEIVTSDGRRLPFSIELARDDTQRGMGLMFRQKLAADSGMLFDFQTDQEVSMWMKNTFIPLDMLFVRADGIIQRIAERTVPQSLEIIPSQGKVRAVLEVNGGTVARLHIHPGDRVSHAMFTGL